MRSIQVLYSRIDIARVHARANVRAGFGVRAGVRGVCSFLVIS